MLRLGATCPKRVVDSVDFDDARIGERFVVGLCLPKTVEQFAPAIRARIMRADAV
jgi:hypothetical protein